MPNFVTKWDQIDLEGERERDRDRETDRQRDRLMCVINSDVE